MTAVRAFDLNQNSLAESEYDDCEKMLARYDADELRRDRDGLFGKSCRRRPCLTPCHVTAPHHHHFELVLQNPRQWLSIQNLKVGVLYEIIVDSL